MNTGYNFDHQQLINQTGMMNNFSLVIHGGAGTILKREMTPEKEIAYTEALESALYAGYEILQKGGTAIDAVETAVKKLEDHPLFNAGRGAVFTHDGKNELDASIMDGQTLKAGSIAGVLHVKNPIAAARAIMEKSQHVMMVGDGAEQFARSQQLDMVDPQYFFTQDRWEQLHIVKSQDEDQMILDHDSSRHTASVKQPENKDAKYGTVGAVALDSLGNLAAATSTGGMTNKKFGRVGDSPIIGAGTYADNNTCAVSCTGWGEYFLRTVAAKTISDLMEYRNCSLKEATEELIFHKIPRLGGDGGLIAIDSQGNIAMPFNTEGMYRGYITQDAKAVVMIYKNDEQGILNDEGRGNVQIS